MQLSDGAWVSFDNPVPRAAASLPLRLLLTLGVLLAVVLALSFIAVRWLSRPLRTLADAAEALGKNIHRPPLPVQGPTEVRQAAQAFNTMQSRLVRYIDDRTQVLAAMSHDLKTPLTRLRLRAELLDDAALRERFEKDLGEMQAMVSDALDALRGLDGPARDAADRRDGAAGKPAGRQRRDGPDGDDRGPRRRALAGRPGAAAPLRGQPDRQRGGLWRAGAESRWTTTPGR